MQVLLVVSVLGLHSVAGQQDGRLGRTVDLVREDGIFHLEQEYA